MTSAELKRRWNEPDGMRQIRAVCSWLFGQAGQPEGLGEVEGRVDLRGIPLTASAAVLGDKADPTAGVVWDSLDLSAAHLDSLRFFGGRVRNCRFDGASVLDLRVWGTEVSDCSFRRANLRSRALGTGDWLGLRTVWRRVAFDRAQLKESVFGGCVIEECSFEKTSRLLQIRDSEVRDCIFRGDLDTLLVDGRGHRYPVSASAFSADFTQAVFRGSSITGYDLDQVALPDQPDLLVVRRYPRVFAEAARWLSDRAVSEADRRAVAFLEGWSQAPGRADSDCCFDSGGLGDADIAQAVEQALAHGSRA